MLFVNNRMPVLMNGKDTQDIVLTLIEVEILNKVGIVVSTFLVAQIIHRMIEVVVFFHNGSITYPAFTERDECGYEIRH